MSKVIARDWCETPVSKSIKALLFFRSLKHSTCSFFGAFLNDSIWMSAFHYSLCSVYNRLVNIHSQDLRQGVMFMDHFWRGIAVFVFLAGLFGSTWLYLLLNLACRLTDVEDISVPVSNKCKELKKNLCRSKHAKTNKGCRVPFSV